MKCVKVESYVVEAGTDRHSPSWRGLQVAVRWWTLMTGVVVWVSVLLERGVGTLHTWGRYEAIILFLFLAVFFLSFFLLHNITL
jgi:hypothetical protein